jgi:hypothetical protein
MHSKVWTDGILASMLNTNILQMIIATFANATETTFDISDSEDEDDVPSTRTPIGWAYVGSHNFTRACSFVFFSQPLTISQHRHGGPYRALRSTHH